MLAGALGLGLVIGLSLGALGGGGSVLVVPALVYLLGQSARDATTSSLVIVGITAVTGALTRLRGGVVDWRTALAFGVSGIPAAYLGTVLNHRVPERALLLAFAALTLLAAAAMLADSLGRSEPPAEPSPAGSGGSALRAPPRVGRTLAVFVVKVLACGLAVGFLTGFLGVGGGFFVVPALVIALRVPMPLTIGTSLLIISVNAVSSLVARLGIAEIDWRVVVPFTVAAVLGSIAGKRLADRLTGAVLTRAFAVLLLLVGALVAARSLGAF